MSFSYLMAHMQLIDKYEVFMFLKSPAYSSNNDGRLDGGPGIIRPFFENGTNWAGCNCRGRIGAVISAGTAGPAPCAFP
jgi:hypothetical protein